MRSFHQGFALTMRLLAGCMLTTWLDVYASLNISCRDRMSYGGLCSSTCFLILSIRSAVNGGRILDCAGHIWGSTSATGGCVSVVTVNGMQ